MVDITLVGDGVVGDGEGDGVVGEGDTVEDGVGVSGSFVSVFVGVGGVLVAVTVTELVGETVVVAVRVLSVGEGVAAVGEGVAVGSKVKKGGKETSPLGVK